MTPTEDLLSSLLAEEAATITRDGLRPLTWPAATQDSYGSGLNRSGRRWLRPLAATASALSVLIVTGLIVVTRSFLTVGPPFANVGTAASPPRYYVEIDLNDNVIVQTTETGRPTDVVQPPGDIHANTNSDAALAVSADGRTYIAAFNDWDTLRTSLFRFTVTVTGQVADFSRLTTGRLPGLTEPSLAVSANGTQLALAGIPDGSRSVEPSSGPPELLVVNLRTGQIRTWHGLTGTGPAYSIENLAWSTNGSLRFLVMKCHPSRAFPFNATCQGGGPAGAAGPPVGAEWTLTIPPGSAPLGPGRVLISLPGVTVQALSGPGADSVTALQLVHSGGIQIARYDVTTGRLQQILYRGAEKSNYAYNELAVDGSGRYVLINDSLGALFGWIRNGQFHKLLIHAPFGNNGIATAIW